MASRGWPATLRLVRHAESTGNVDADAARRAGQEMWRTEARDPDVDLSPAGRSQARELGRAMAALPGDDIPTSLWSSPFLRARETASVALAGCGTDWNGIRWTVDERLRDRELGVLDRLTGLGIKARYPELAELRVRMGKFYFRPPGGESWVDVGQRLRTVLDDIRDQHEAESVIIFAHDVVVLMFRYLIEGLDEAAILEIGRKEPVRNCGVTTYRSNGGRLRLASYNQMAP